MNTTNTYSGIPLPTLALYLTFYSHSTKNLFLQLREVDAEIGGVLALKDGQQDVRDFIAHYRLLDPEKNARNPWFKQYWEQVCCMGIPYANQFAQY